MIHTERERDSLCGVSEAPACPLHHLRWPLVDCQFWGKPSGPDVESLDNWAVTVFHYIRKPHEKSPWQNTHFPGLGSFTPRQMCLWAGQIYHRTPAFHSRLYHIHTVPLTHNRVLAMNAFFRPLLFTNEEQLCCKTNQNKQIDNRWSICQGHEFPKHREGIQRAEQPKQIHKNRGVYSREVYRGPNHARSRKPRSGFCFILRMF